MPRIICDSSSIISLMDTCTSGALTFLHDQAGVRFLIPPGVYDELVSRPLGIKRFGYSAVRMRGLVEKGVLELKLSEGLSERTTELLGLANTTYFVDARPLHILDEGEAECLAYLKGVRKPLLLVDEKTTRLLIEEPHRLHQIIEGEYQRKVTVNETNLNRFKELVGPVFVMRSTELVAMAVKRGFFKEYGEHALEAFHSALYALRFAGCSISSDELIEYEKLLL